MEKNPKTGLLVVAYHEAGHAVADWVHCFKLKKISIVPKANALGSVSSVLRLQFATLAHGHLSGARIGRYHERIVCLLAGRAAQRRFRPQSIRSFHASSDITHASQILDLLHKDEEELRHAYRYLEARARHFVSGPQHWQMIQDLAKALIERQTMTGDEIEASFGANMGAQTPLRWAANQGLEAH